MLQTLQILLDKSNAKMYCFLEGDSSGEEGKSYLFLSCHHFFLITYTILQSNTEH